MKKIAILLVVLILFLGLGAYILQKSQKAAIDPRAATYMVEGMQANYFGNDATGDLNGDGRDDTAFLVTASGGGSGTFYYAVAALKTPGGYSLTNPVFIGDRIAPQTTEIRGGQLVVNYADRKTGQPMSAAPSVGVSKYFTVSGTTLAPLK